ncbi:MAG: ATP-binding cassette domain-containing protein [Gemmatimonadetes bacterium]|nr:ATP-binding cassette domain-containing protein [Gemmatimonadota bacterium]
MAQLARWRALGGLLWSAARWRAAGFALLALVGGLLPTAVILLTGELVHAIPAAVAHGLTAPGGRPAVLALAALALALALAAAAGNWLQQQGGALDAAYALQVHTTVARITLGAPTVAPLEDPSLADELEAVKEAERRGVLRMTASELAYVAMQRLRGWGAFVVLLGFRWWAPLVLAAAWWLTNRVYLLKTEKGMTVEDGAPAMRRAEYLRSLALDAPAARELRVFGLGGWAVGRYNDAMNAALAELWAARGAARGLALLATALLVAAHVAVLGALALAAAHGTVSVAALLVFAQAAIATADLGLVGDSQWWLAQSVAVAGKVAALRERAAAWMLSDAPPAAPAPARPGQVAVRLDGVSFTYRGRAVPVLDGLTLNVPAGQSLAVVGENGAGKSTLMKLLCGLYEPQAGTVTFDGGQTPLQARGRVGVIFQDFVRYPLALRENVGFGHLPLLRDDAALTAALGDAGAGDLLRALPHGLDTLLTREEEGGADLSGGQWQRVALARALAAVRGGAGLLILDEPTAALDVRAETELFERFLELTRGVTTILVSHRLSSVRRADRIVVVEGGRVVEDGTHEGLMRAGGRYAGMFALQAERFAAAAVGEEVDDA